MNQPYPRLNSQNILYHVKTNHFVLSPIPVVIKGFGINQRGYTQNRYKDQYLRQEKSNKEFSMDGKLTDNCSKLILLIHYFEQLQLKYSTNPQKISKQKLTDPKQWIKLLFGYQKRQQINKFNRTCKQLITQNKQNQRQFLIHLIKTQNFTKYLLNYFYRIKIKQNQQQQQQQNNNNNNKIKINFPPTLLQLDKLFALNSHVTSMSTTRIQYLLFLRYKIGLFLLDIARNSYQKILCKQEILGLGLNQIDIRNVYIQISSTYFIIYHIYSLVAMEMLTIVRLQDIKIIQQIQRKLKRFFNKQDHDKEDKQDKVDKIEKGINQTQRNNPKHKILCSYLRLIRKKLLYLYDRRKQNNNNYNTQQNKLILKMIYSKALLKILNNLSKNNLHEQKYQKIYDKISKGKKLLYFRNIGLIFRILIKLLIKMDNNNIYWCQYYVFRKIKDFIQKDSTNAGDLMDMQEQVAKKVGDMSNNAVWGVFWNHQNLDDLTVD